MIEQIIGAMLVAVGVADLLITVLYARIGTHRGSRFGMGSARWLARGIWEICCWAAPRDGAARSTLLSMAAPLILVALVVLWASLLTVGAAMIFHPMLGDTVRRTAGPTPTDFVSAMYVAGSSLSVVANSDFAPQATLPRCVFLIDAFIGASALTLTVTYLMQIYRALETRNALGLKLRAMTAGSNSAVDLVLAWGPCGRFDLCYSSIAEVAGELISVHEAHHLYPLLFYFRFDTNYPNLVLYLPTLLEASTLLCSAVDQRQYPWLHRSAAVQQLWHGSNSLLDLLERVFIPDRFESDQPAQDLGASRSRFAGSCDRFRAAGIAVTEDLNAGHARYALMFERWHHRSVTMAAYLGHSESSVLAQGPSSGRPSADDGGES